MKIGLIIDPLASLQTDMDSSLLITAEARRRGHRVYAATLDDLHANQQGCQATWQEIAYDGTGKPGCIDVPCRDALSAMDIIVMRKDPPVDEAYLTACFLLERADTPVVNSPTGLRLYNEKISHLSWSDGTGGDGAGGDGAGRGFAPPTLVSRNTDDILHFLSEHPDGVVCKPVNLYSGKGVFRLNRGEAGAKAAIAKATGESTNFIIVQRYLPEVSQGDKRVYLIEGRPIGWMNRRPRTGDWLANIHRGARPEPTDLSERDHAIINAVARGLAPYDLPLSCIDIIGPYLTEVNVTSPSGLPEINRVSGKACEKDVVDYLETRAQRVPDPA